MKKIAAAALAALLLALPLAGWAAYEDLFKTTHGAAWAVYVRNVGGMQAICSATAFESDARTTTLLTAGHCFIGSDLRKTDFLVTQDHKNFYKATLTRSGLKTRVMSKPTSADLDDYEGNDWAVVSADVGGQKTMPLGDSGALAIGEDLVVVGLPFGMDFLAVQGIVGSTDLSLSKLVWNHYFGANIFIAGGNSGSAVVSAKQRDIVGVVVAGPGSQSSLCIFAPIAVVKADLARSEPPGAAAGALRP